MHYYDTYSLCLELEAKCRLQLNGNGLNIVLQILEFFSKCLKRVDCDNVGTILRVVAIFNTLGADKQRENELLSNFLAAILDLNTPSRSLGPTSKHAETQRPWGRHKEITQITQVFGQFTMISLKYIL